MATIHSLICWGGRVGKVVSISATTDRVTSTSHGLKNGQKLWPSGTLPGELSVLVAVYARYYSANEFTLHTSAAHAVDGIGQITFAGSSTYAAVTLTSDCWVALTTDQKARYGTAGSERAYASLGAWNTARTSAAAELDTEIAEVGEAFDDVTTTGVSINIPCAIVDIAPEINGVKTSAWHGGIYGAGYRLADYTNYTDCIDFQGFNTTFRDMTILHDAGGGTAATTVNGMFNEFKNNFVIGHFAGKTSHGIYVQGTANKVLNNVVVGFNAVNYVGIYHWQYMGGGTIVAGNLVTKCDYGFQRSGASSNGGFYYNNVSVGNAAGRNWGTIPAGLTKAGYNFGESGDTPWNIGTATAVTTMNEAAGTPQFVDWTNNNFHPTSASPAKEAGRVVSGIAARDIAGDLRPNYLGPTQDITVTAGAFVTGYKYTIVTVGSTSFTSIGASANTVGVVFVATGAGSGTGTASVAAYWDAGPFEYDNGFGNPPATLTLAANVALTGAEVRVYDKNASGNDLGTELDGTESAAGATVDYSVSGGNTIWIQIMKDGYEEFGQEYVMPADSTTFTAILRADINT